MRQLISMCALSIALASFALAAPQAGAFRFRPERVEAGVVYHYLKTNVDGTKPEHVSLYVVSADRIEAFKFHPKSERAGLVVAEMDRGRVGDVPAGAVLSEVDLTTEDTEALFPLCPPW